MSKEKTFPARKLRILIPMILFLSQTVCAQHESKTINDGWKFHKGECEAAASPAYDDSAWTVSYTHLTLPTNSRV